MISQSSGLKTRTPHCLLKHPREMKPRYMSFAIACRVWRQKKKKQSRIQSKWQKGGGAREREKGEKTTRRASSIEKKRRRRMTGQRRYGRRRGSEGEWKAEEKCERKKIPGMRNLEVRAGKGRGEERKDRERKKRGREGSRRRGPEEHQPDGWMEGTRQRGKGEGEMHEGNTRWLSTRRACRAERARWEERLCIFRKLEEKQKT